MEGRKEGREGRKEGIGERECVALLLRESINQFCSYTYIHKYITSGNQRAKTEKAIPKKEQTNPRLQRLLAIITHIIQLGIDKLPTAAIRPLIINLHVGRHAEIPLTHILAVTLDEREGGLDAALGGILLHAAALVVEFDFHLVHAVEVGRDGEADFILLGVAGRLVRVRGEGPHVAVLGAEGRGGEMGGVPAGVDLAEGFLRGAGELFADERVLLEPVVVVPLDVGPVALVALLAGAGEAHVVGDEGGVGVVVVVLVLEDVRFFVAPVLRHAHGRVAVAQGRGEPVARGRGERAA